MQHISNPIETLLRKVAERCGHDYERTRADVEAEAKIRAEIEADPKVQAYLFWRDQVRERPRKKPDHRNYHRPVILGV